MDIGESLVGAHFRHVIGCEVVTYNNFFVDRQGEVDIIALKQGETRTVWLCEVTTHIGGMLIVRNGKNATERVIADKLERLHHFAQSTFPGEEHRYEWWSPRVAVGALTEAMDAVADEWTTLGRDLTFVINEDYTDRIRTLAKHAGGNSSTTNEPAYRMLQVLTRLRGGNFSL